MYLSKYRSLFIALISLLFITVSATASAHQMSTGYLNLKIDDQQPQQLTGQIQLRWFDIDRKINIDLNKDGTLHWHEVLLQQIPISEFILNNLTLSSLNTANKSDLCVINLAEKMQTDEHFDEGYLVYNFTATCSNPVLDSALIVNYSGIFDLDTDHKLIVSLQAGQSH